MFNENFRYKKREGQWRVATSPHPTIVGNT